MCNKAVSIINFFRISIARLEISVGLPEGLVFRRLIGPEESDHVPVVLVQLGNQLVDRREVLYRRRDLTE